MNNTEKLKNLGLRDYYYYCFDGATVANVGQVVVCLLVDPRESDLFHRFVSRGLAICSPIEIFSKIEGRHIALGRAIQAVEKHSNVEPIISRNFAYGQNLALLFAKVFGFKASYFPSIANRIERTILNRKERKVNA